MGIVSLRIHTENNFKNKVRFSPVVKSKKQIRKYRKIIKQDVTESKPEELELALLSSDVSKPCFAERNVIFSLHKMRLWADEFFAVYGIISL